MSFNFFKRNAKKIANRIDPDLVVKRNLRGYNI